MKPSKINKHKTLLEELDFSIENDSNNQIIIDLGLKVTKTSKTNKFGKEGQLYTVEQVGPWGVVLSYVDENGKHRIKVEKEVLEKEFSL